MRPFIAKIAGVCFFTSLLLVGATSSRSQNAPPPPAASAPAQAAAPAQSSDGWPDGPGKDTFLRICSQCHGAENVLGQSMDASGWTDVLQTMINNGAQGSDADFSAILNYLVTNFGPVPAKVNMNTATAANMHAWLSMPTDQAQAIVDYRTKNGDFKSLDDVKKVPGVDAKFLDSIKDHLTFDSSGSGTGSSASTGTTGGAGSAAPTQ